MTCGSCAARVERKLNKLDGVSATVNYATETAAVTYPDAVSVPDLVAQVEAAGYTAEAPEPDSFPWRLVAAVVLGLPVILLAMVPGWQFDGWQWVSLALATPVVAYSGWPFHAAALKNLRHGATTMDTLISLGTLAAYLWSVWALVFGSAGELGMRHPFSFTGPAGDPIYLETAAGVTAFLLAGRYAEARAKRTAGSALRELLALGAKDVAVLRDGRESRVPVSELTVGDVFVVRPGETIAADGVVADGRSAVDVSRMTGESVPAEVGPGDAVVGGCVNASGRLTVRATRVGRETQLARMAQLVAEAQNGKAPVQRLADEISAIFVPVVLVLAVATLAGWLASGAGATAAFTAAVAVLIIACPCALGLATPTALLVGTGRGAQLGILIRGPEVLESTRRVDTIVLDKTGTLTTGVMTLVAVQAVTRGNEALRLAAGVERASEHPIAAAIAAAVDDPPPVTDFVALPGHGARGTVDGHTVYVGRPAEAGPTNGTTTVAVVVDGETWALLDVADAPRESGPDAVRALRKLGLTPWLVTGDGPGAARHVADLVGIDPEHTIAGALPTDKVDVVKKLQADGRIVAVAGDGVNDAAALAQADLGLAMGTGTDAAIAAADLTLVSGDLAKAPTAIRLSRATLGIIRGNLFWAFAYNVAALPLAGLGLLNPMIAGAAMALSSVAVVLNSLRLRGFRATPTPGRPG
ncbi:cadmium-translocating P-type ATPase [Cryptosporangium phraense]|uniref:Cadmium-translocating P-type ATPase n=2 Tax=Cryptosporangium phraense TaxID=2593070 RepID=A0A545AG33_9ACTN|nr:cadmium-translocating P-type ATPase [Cryptosporangium phraense]